MPASSMRRPSIVSRTCVWLTGSGGKGIRPVLGPGLADVETSRPPQQPTGCAPTDSVTRRQACHGAASRQRWQTTYRRICISWNRVRARPSPKAEATEMELGRVTGTVVATEKVDGPRGCEISHRAAAGQTAETCLGAPIWWQLMPSTWRVRVSWSTWLLPVKRWRRCRYRFVPSRPRHRRHCRRGPRRRASS